MNQTRRKGSPSVIMHFQRIIILTCWLYVSARVRPDIPVDKPRENPHAPVAVPRVRRSGALMPASVSMQSLKNASIMICSDALNQQMARMVELSDEQLKGVFNDKGGNYVKEYMAATEAEAKQNFPDMLQMTRPVTVKGSSSPFNEAANSVMKDVILKDLVRLTAYFQSQNMTSNHTDALTTDIHGETTSASTTTSDVYRGTSPVSGPGGINNSFRLSSPHSARPSFPSTPSGPTSGQAPSTQAGPTTGQAPSTQTRPTTGQDPSMQARPTTGQAPSTQAGPTTGQPASTQTRPTTGQAPSTQARPTTGQAVPSTTVDPDVSKSLSQLLQYVNGNMFHNNSRRDLDHLWRAANTALHPALLLELTLAREKRFLSSTDDSSTIEDYCHVRGTHTEDDRYVHLCSICAATTRLADDFFPRYINEAICKTGDTDCFSIAGTPHGQCKQTRFSLHMMRRKPETCRMLLHDGEALVFDDWELVPTWIRVACECTINKLSTFSRFAGNENLVG